MTKELFKRMFDVLFEESFEDEFEDEREYFATVADAVFDQTQHVGTALTVALKHVCSDLDFYNEVYVEKFGECPEIAPKL